MNSPTQDNKPTSLRHILETLSMKLDNAAAEMLDGNPLGRKEWKIAFEQAEAAIAALYESAVPEKRNHTSVNTPSFDYYTDRGFDQAINQIHANFKQIRGGKL